MLEGLEQFPLTPETSEAKTAALDTTYCVQGIPEQFGHFTIFEDFCTFYIFVYVCVHVSADARGHQKRMLIPQIWNYKQVKGHSAQMLGNEHSCPVKTDGVPNC